MSDGDVELQEPAEDAVVAVADKDEADVDEGNDAGDGEGNDAGDDDGQGEGHEDDPKIPRGIGDSPEVPNRHCRDCLCIIMFLIYWTIMMGVGILGFEYERTRRERERERERERTRESASERMREGKRVEREGVLSGTSA
jgi:hypothetical protein